MRNVRIPILLLVSVGVIWAFARPAEVAADRGRERIALEDDCDPTDLAAPPVGWGPGGCLREEGTVTRAEFAFFSNSPLVVPRLPPPGTPLAQAVIGHPSWRNNPGYLVVEVEESLRVKNNGGRDHTFTPVADYGGGLVPPLNFGLAPAPECQAPNTPAVILPGRGAEVKGLAPGSYKFQCCFHPWMRTLVKVTEDDDDH